MALDMIYSVTQRTEEPSVGKSWTAQRPSPEERLVVALDTPTAAAAERLVDKLDETDCVYKIGLELVFGGGLELAARLKARGKRVFLDMKLLDIGNTVEKAVANVADAGFDFLTVHGFDRKTMDAAVKGRGNSGLNLLAVTVLTNLLEADLKEQGIFESASSLAVRRAKMASDAGFDGVIASPHEARAIRAATRQDFIIKTPGIRPSGAARNDQARVMSPGAAIREGATYLVVGRPIIENPEPLKAAIEIQREIREALKSAKPRPLST